MILSDKNMKSLNVTKNSELIKVEQWLNANKLSLNYSKTKYLLIKPFAKHSHTNEFSASTQGIQVGNCHLAKYLGVIIDRARPIYIGRYHGQADISYRCLPPIKYRLRTITLNCLFLRATTTALDY